MRYCQQCGAPNQDNATYCTNCGATLAPAMGQGYQQPYQQPAFQQPYRQAPYVRMGFKDAIRVCMKEKYASFEGRATRTEFWLFYLYYMIFAFVGMFVGAVAGGLIGYAADDFSLTAVVYFVVAGLIGLAFFIPYISATVRRLHDTGRSGWWFWIILVPFFGSIILIILLLLESEGRDNEYGPYVIN